MKKVLITGGNKGIGLAITKKFLENNYEVYVVCRDIENFKLKHKNLQTVQYDLRKTEDIKFLVHEIWNMDVLINNAGIMNALPFDDYPEDKIIDIVNINLKTPIALITELSKPMIQKGGGRIVSVASIAGEIGHPDIWYGITKAGVINFTKSFAKILGPKGVVINCVAPGPVNTEMLRTKIPKDRVANLVQNSILQRIAEPEEIARIIFWLATDSPDYINGFCIDANNGAFMR